MKTVGEKAEAALRAVRESSVIAFDTETSGVDWKVNQSVGYVITPDSQNSYYVPVRHGGGGNLMDANCAPLTTPTERTKRHQFEIELAKAFEDRRRLGYRTIGHNLPFDCHFAANEEIYLGRNLECTQINEALLNEYSRSFSLDACATAHKVTAKKGDELYQHLADRHGGEAKRSQMEHFWRTNGNEPVVVEYAAGDGITTLELAEAQHIDIKEQGLTAVHDLESQLIWTVFRIERRGIKVDENRLAEVIEAVKARIVQAEQKLPARFNTRSPKDVRELMEGAGHTDWPTTGKGNPSFTEKWLKRYEEGRAVVNVRKLTNLQNSFLNPLAERHMFKGRVHSSLNQMKTDEYGTISGRFSSSNPNMQQVPKRDKELGKLFRSVFVPDEGMEYYEGDYSSCEPRLFAHYSADPTLVAGYNAIPPKDVHQIVAEMLSVERDPTAKRMNMGMFTGLGIATFAGHMEWPQSKAAEMYNKWHNTFPAIKGFQNKATNVMKERGYVLTVLKRRCRMDDPRYAYRATSKIIQGSNADIVKYYLLKADLLCESWNDIVNLLMTIHDSYNWQAPATEDGRAKSKEIEQVCCDVQSEPFNLRVPFKMDLGFGPTWSIATWGT